MVINLRDAPHHPAQYLFPWYINGSLDEAESASVEAHLAECPECRAEVEAELGLAARLMTLGHDLDLAADEQPAAQRRGRSALRFLHRPVSLGWVLAGQAAASALLLAIFLPGETDAGDPAYHVQGSGTAPGAANLIVLFAPEAREQAVRDALLEAGARVVDGPTASGAYLLRVTEQRRSSALERLRADPQVTLAEPIGGQ